MNLNLSENINNNQENFSKINISEAAEKRILEIKSNPKNENKFLRILVSGGGCSGFQYNFNLDDKINGDDFKLEKNGQILVVSDNVSLEFVHDCLLDFVQDLSGSHFKINNPNAKASCGCGSSFSV
jgi:iron-sulfur cluster insertion protein